MTLQEAVEAIRQAGAVLTLDAHGPLLRGSVDVLVVETLRQHKDQLTAVLRLRQVHKAMGLDDTDVAMIEAALLSGKVNNVVIVPGPPGGRVA
jgi:hypothetical protein